jgi:outer membrane protein OmpA-like peptidoglycan-associated protein
LIENRYLVNHPCLDIILNSQFAATNAKRLVKTLFTVSITALAFSFLTACQTPPPAPKAPAPYSGPVLPIEQSERGVQIFLPSAVLFEVGKAEFKPGESASYLDRVATLLTTKTGNKVEVEGHTDSTGSASANQKLSDLRAESTLKALLERGVPADRLSSVGYSFNRPVASNATDDGKKLNRRVELVILDEKVENITRGEPEGAFVSAWANLKRMVEQGLVKVADAEVKK